MIPKYRTQIRLCQAGEPAALEAVRATTCDWIAEKEGCDSGIVEAPGHHVLSERAAAEVVHEIVGDAEQWAIRYQRQDDKEPLSWIVDVGISANDADTVTSISMGIEVRNQRVINLDRRFSPSCDRAWLGGVIRSDRRFADFRTICRDRRNRDR